MKTLSAIGCLSSAAVLGKALIDGDLTKVILAAFLLVTNVYFYTENRR
ncbi:hypothetical protein [Stenotrophomonas phage BUCT555]|nr:hypothetical protein [Stenotrophomonas phage BUCT555]